VISTSGVPVGRAIGDLAEARAGERGRRRAIASIEARAGGRPAVAFDALALAERIFGSQAPANSLLLGAAWQLGRVPLSLEALQAAFRLNGVAIDANLAAFAWGSGCGPRCAGALPGARRRRADERDRHGAPPRRRGAGGR
jgi:indolepyruvate ferredoxin oxidoreductase